ncbi:MAG: MIP/aquaporin family protein [Planctomycetota bacterium]|nr:MIP/aquaporin family protein [Planctomycetota bacterium]
MDPIVAEFLGTTILLLLGQGVVANVSLSKTTAAGEPKWMIITTAWGLAVFVAVFMVGAHSGAHLNPAVTLGLFLAGKFQAALVAPYLLAQLGGAMLGSLVVYVCYLDHYRATTDEEAVRGTFCTAPAIRSLPRNLLTEAIGTFVLVLGVLLMAKPTLELAGVEVADYGLGAIDALPVGLLVWVIGLALGGPTGYAINPARDLGPRLVFALVRRRAKASPDWGYAWVPVVGPALGGALAALVFAVVQ